MHLHRDCIGPFILGGRSSSAATCGSQRRRSIERRDRNGNGDRADGLHGVLPRSRRALDIADLPSHLACRCRGSEGAARRTRRPDDEHLTHQLDERKSGATAACLGGFDGYTAQRFSRAEHEALRRYAAASGTERLLRSCIQLTCRCTLYSHWAHLETVPRLALPDSKTIRRTQRKRRALSVEEAGFSPCPT